MQISLPLSNPESRRTPGRFSRSNSAATPGTSKRVQDPALRLPVGGGVLGVQADLDRVAARARRAVEVERPALGDAQLQRDQVDAEDGLGDRVLDLEAGVHLQEEKRSVSAS